MPYLPELANELFGRASVPAATCYGPNGVAADNKIIPCNAALVTGGGASMCCSMGVNSANDTCHPTGLCQNSGLFFRDFCTDSTWQDPNCLNICTDPDDHGSSTYVQVFPCGVASSGDPTYCCGANLDDANCCTDSTAVLTLAATLVAAQVTVTASGTGQIGAATVTVTNTPATVTVSPELIQSPKQTDGATIGLGAALGAVVLASVAGFFLLRRKWKPKTPQVYNELDGASPYVKPENSSQFNGYQDTSYNSPPPVEMYAVGGDAPKQQNEMNRLR